MASIQSGEEILCRALKGLGARCVFGMPGTQNVPLFEALRRGRLRTVLPTSELAGSFMANGYARVSGDPGVLVTIPGPGFTWALPGLAEARLDSVPLLHIVGAPAERGGPFGHQVLPQAEIAAPLVKEVVHARTAADVGTAVRHAYRLTRSGEPGPVLLQVARRVFETTAESQEVFVPEDPAAPSGSAVGGVGRESSGLRGLVESVGAARRPVLFLGMGAASAAEGVCRLAERLRAPVLTTGSGRGIVPEDHPLSLGFDFVRGGISVVNDLLAQADLVLALGCKLSHNGTGGFQLDLPPERLAHVNTDVIAFLNVTV